MKLSRKNKFWLTILVVPLLVATCMTITEIIHPSDPQVNSSIDITVKIKIVAETDGTSQLAFGILAPKKWNIRDNAMLTLTTQGYALGNVTKELMTLIPVSEQAPKTGLPWADAFQREFGLMGNLGPMEWVVFSSTTAFQINDNIPGQKEVTGDVKITLATGDQNIKCFMGYTFCGRAFAFDSEKWKENSDNPKSKVLALTGGAGPVVDYTVAGITSTVPSNFGYGDIFAINFQEIVGDAKNALFEAPKVYLWGKVVYDGGQEKIVDATTAKTLMEKIGDTSWQKYIYPKEFFGLPENAIIESIYVHFSNEDQSIVVQNDNDEDFPIAEACE